MDSRQIGFVGLGRMGGPMVARLLAAGHKVTVFDTSAEAVRRAEERGAIAAASPKGVGDNADIVLVSLPTPDIVRAVVLGADGVAGGERVKTVIDLSTSGPSAAAHISAGLAETGRSWLDCPVSGGIAGATNGTLAVMVSGPRAAFDQAEDIIAKFGRIFYVGEKAGLAQVAKLANNLLAAAAMVVSSEAMVMGAKAGIDPQVLLDIINAGSGRNSATQDKFPKSVLPGSFDFGFATGLSYKDVRMCIDEAEAMGVPMVAGAVVRQMLAVTNAKFGPGSDFTSICRVVEEWGGVEVRA
ncbi:MULTISPECIES: NAD(P)-dependent oxidoreductase [unclassified Chelatococcus]|uniref:NAD(P)-dependent oxidoreductase n=1 Tax=unclassified Chelatococcus TaxID=2638111 RepID=UPI001BCA93E0|nr:MULTISPECIES: NAD(P)-dependent oxidoreductase [unclassified Chelatococcus]MBS7699989.1 NAD(P)-dependent oxidoreductase [Chelatococcus sp. YT9]MBX3558586.1 NAD(P)-dependent oxidoreductase [Chelatococcus sp.]